MENCTCTDRFMKPANTVQLFCYLLWPRRVLSQALPWNDCRFLVTWNKGELVKHPKLSLSLVFLCIYIFLFSLISFSVCFYLVFFLFWRRKTLVITFLKINSPIDVAWDGSSHQAFQTSLASPHLYSRTLREFLEDGAALFNLFVYTYRILCWVCISVKEGSSKYQNKISPELDNEISELFK